MAEQPEQTFTQGSGTEFMARVRHALGHSAQGTLPRPESVPVRPERLLRQVAATDPKRVSRWIAMAEKNGMVVRRSRAIGLTQAVEDCLRSSGVKSIMLNLADVPEGSLRGDLAARGYQVSEWGEEHCAQRVYETDASVTDCRYGIADTGALLVWSDSGFGRSTTLTVPLHIVLLPAPRIVADLIDALPRVRRDAGGLIPSNVVIINGPSKTADIEMNLVTGVHGPKFLHVIVIDD